MKEETEIITDSVNLKWFFITFIIVSMGGTFLFANIAIMCREPLIGVGGLAVFIIIPLILLKKIIIFFTKHVKIVFSEDNVLLLMKDRSTGLWISENQFFYQDIRSYTTNNSAQGKTSSICLEMVDIGKKKYIFNNLKGVDQGNVGEIIYNNIKMRKPNIVLKPTFFASNFGRVYIIGMAIFLTVLLLLHIFYSPKTSPFTFLISISLFINILFQRKKDIDSFKRLNNGD